MLSKQRPNIYLLVKLKTNLLISQYRLIFSCRLLTTIETTRSLKSFQICFSALASRYLQHRSCDHQTYLCFSKTPKSIMFDLNVILMILFSELCILIGASWSGAERHKLHLLEQNPMHRSLSNSESASGRKSSKTGKSSRPAEKLSSLHLSLTNVVVYVILMSLLLLALYWFFKYLIYFLLLLFTLGSLVSVYTCVRPILSCVLPTRFNHFRPPFPLAFASACTHLSIGFAIALTAAWFFTRHNACGWFWHDLIGVCFVVGALKNIRMPNFRLICWLLMLLFVYDIFFVFVTPLLTSDGSSIMVRVAVGDTILPNRTSAARLQPEHTPLIPTNNTSYWSNGERVPMVFRVPYFARSTWTYCYADYGFLFLGYGDILVPGLLISYANFHDRLYSIPRRPYYTISSIFYALGLILTSVFVYIMEGTGQPALLYLVPATVIPVACLAAYRNEWSAFWNGPTPALCTDSGPIAQYKSPNSHSSALPSDSVDIENDANHLADHATNTSTTTALVNTTPSSANNASAV